MGPRYLSLDLVSDIWHDQRGLLVVSEHFHLESEVFGLVELLVGRRHGHAKTIGGEVGQVRGWHRLLAISIL